MVRLASWLIDTHHSIHGHMGGVPPAGSRPAADRITINELHQYTSCADQCEIWRFFCPAICSRRLETVAWCG